MRGMGAPVGGYGGMNFTAGMGALVVAMELRWDRAKK
jgi:hypothetical protein